ncbi:MAG: DUF3016 domain-containing protein [Thalassotalea sp.]
MKRVSILSMLFSSAMALTLAVPTVHAAGLEITFADPENFADMRPGEENKTQFVENVFYNIEKELTKLAEQLPEDQLLKIDVSDIDLAGDISMHNANLFRLVKTMFPPRLAFTYQLIDKNKMVLKSGEENIRDTSFMTNQGLKYKRDAFGYEKQLLAQWFKDTFK